MRGKVTGAVMVAAVAILAVACSPAQDPAHGAARESSSFGAGQKRIYYIAADELDWDYSTLR